MHAIQQRGWLVGSGEKHLRQLSGKFVGYGRLLGNALTFAHFVEDCPYYCRLRRVRNAAETG